MNRSPLRSTDYEHTIGVFRIQEQAHDAIAALLQAGFERDHILVTDYHARRASDARVLVHVFAPDREQEAVNILVRHGANNSDIPPGTEIVKGDLILRDPSTTSGLS